MNAIFDSGPPAGRYTVEPVYNQEKNLIHLLLRLKHTREREVWGNTVAVPHLYLYTYHLHCWPALLGHIPTRLCLASGMFQSVLDVNVLGQAMQTPVSIVTTYPPSLHSPW